MRIARGLTTEADQSASSRVHTWSSASGGAPWLRKITGIRFGRPIDAIMESLRH
jgi:hypothetical protein